MFDLAFSFGLKRADIELLEREFESSPAAAAATAAAAGC